jgi:hypothetical protein
MIKWMEPDAGPTPSDLPKFLREFADSLKDEYSWATLNSLRAAADEIDDLRDTLRMHTHDKHGDPYPNAGR